MGWNVTGAGAIAAALLLTACGGGTDAPKGQVVAQVNGQDITLSELNAELLANKVPAGADDKAATQVILQRLIARKLLVASAREQKLDKSSEYLLARQRTEENDLAGLTQRQAVAQVKGPTREEAEKFVKDNPGIFNNRKLMVLEQIRFPQPANANDLKFLEPAKSLDEVAELLRQNAVKFERVPTVFDTTSVDPKLAARIDALPPGEVFVISAGNMVLANAIREKRPAAIPPEAGLQYAAQTLRQQRMAKAVQGQLEKLRKDAEISYQPGYAPAKPDKAKPSPADAKAAPGSAIKGS